MILTERFGLAETAYEAWLSANAHDGSANFWARYTASRVFQWTIVRQLVGMSTAVTCEYVSANMRYFVISVRIQFGNSDICEQAMNKWRYTDHNSPNRKCIAAAEVLHVAEGSSDDDTLQVQRYDHPGHVARGICPNYEPYQQCIFVPRHRASKTTLPSRSMVGTIAKTGSWHSWRAEKGLIQLATDVDFGILCVRSNDWTHGDDVWNCGMLRNGLAFRYKTDPALTWSVSLGVAGVGCCFSLALKATPFCEPLHYRACDGLLLHFPVRHG